MKVKMRDFEKSVDILLKSYGDECTDAIKEVLPEIGKEAAARLRNDSRRLFNKGKGEKHYASGWRRKVTKGNTFVEVGVYNSSKPTVTHLLENGHNGLVPIRRKGGGYYYKSVGWVPGRPHIAPVNDWAQEEALKRLEKKL